MQIYEHLEIEELAEEGWNNLKPKAKGRATYELLHPQAMILSASFCILYI